MILGQNKPLGPMSRVDEYKKKKMIEEMKLPKLWVIHSDREGVSMPRQLQVVAIDEIGERHYEYYRTKVKRYKFEEEPFSIDIEEGRDNGRNHGYGSGFGDLWCWTWFCSFSEEESLDYYRMESARIEETYLKQKESKMTLPVDVMQFLWAVDNYTDPYSENYIGPKLSGMLETLLNKYDKES